MNSQHYFQAIKKNYLFIILISILGLALLFFFSALQTWNYASTTEVMVIQKQLTETDSYLAAKSAEKVAANLAQAMYTSTFFDKVANSGLVDLSELSALDEVAKRKEWASKISVQPVAETGMLKITAYDPKPEQAEQLAQALAYTLSTSGSEYHGAGENIQIKIINTPLTSQYPVKPNILANLGLGLALGLLTSLIYLYFRPQVNFSLKGESQRIIPPSVPQVVQPTEEDYQFAVKNKPQSKPLSYHVLNHRQTPQIDSPDYRRAPRITTMFDHYK